MAQVNRSLGEMAVGAELMSAEATAKVNSVQRACDLPFGELAVEMGLLSDEQLEELLEEQARTRLKLGEALVQRGALTRERADELLRDFEQDQASYRCDAVQLPDSLAGHPVAAPVIDLLPKLLMRIARIVCRIGRSDEAGSSASYPHRVRIVVRGTPGLSIALLGDEDFARQLAEAASGLDPADIDRAMLDDGISEFLNVLAGNAMGVLEREGIVTELEPPQCDVQASAGCCFELAVSAGRAALLLAPV
jgi:hypothetical protein